MPGAVHHSQPLSSDEVVILRTYTRGTYGAQHYARENRAQLELLCCPLPDQLGACTALPVTLAQVPHGNAEVEVRSPSACAVIVVAAVTGQVSLCVVAVRPVLCAALVSLPVSRPLIGLGTAPHRTRHGVSAVECAASVMLRPLVARFSHELIMNSLNALYKCEPCGLHVWKTTGQCRSLSMRSRAGDIDRRRSGSIRQRESQCDDLQVVQQIWKA
mmetsp:Transcript_16889/g.50426  ORF Transcript_16889/g.50426 Transcript_16889/m.50426 type:complete len:216 (-) Transcript_16889:19-666(-)